jgi:hypothetical protein
MLESEIKIMAYMDKKRKTETLSALSLAIAENLNAAFNLYGRSEDSKTEAAKIVADGIRELESQHSEMRTLLLRIHSARIGMNEDAVIAALYDVDAFFRDQEHN